MFNNLNKFYVNNWALTLIKLMTSKSHGNSTKYKIIMRNVIAKLKLNINVSIDNFILVILNNLKLPFRLVKRQVAGKKLWIPYRISSNRIIVSSLRLIVSVLHKRKESSIEEKLYNELMDIFNNQGHSLKLREDLCKEINTNIANLRFIKKKKMSLKRIKI